MERKNFASTFATLLFKVKPSQIKLRMKRPIIVNCCLGGLDILPVARKMLEIKHCNVESLIGITKIEDHYAMVTHFMENKDLRGYLQQIESEVCECVCRLKDVVLKCIVK